MKAKLVAQEKKIHKDKTIADYSFFLQGGTTVDIGINESGWAHTIALHRVNLYGINCKRRNTSN